MRVIQRIFTFRIELELPVRPEGAASSFLHPDPPRKSAHPSRTTGVNHLHKSQIANARLSRYLENCRDKALALSMTYKQCLGTQTEVSKAEYEKVCKMMP